MDEKIQLILFKIQQLAKQAEENMGDPVMHQFNKGVATAYNKVLEMFEKEMN